MIIVMEVVHYRQAAEVRAAWREVMNEACRMNPDRFVRKTLESPRHPDNIWINPPEPRSHSVDRYTKFFGL
jgi:hypothetical protein